MARNQAKVSIIPLGGLGEIGKNMTVVRFGESLLVIDCGLMFPEDEMLGIDIVIPDMSFLIENAAAVKGIILTHGHEDHIGGIPYLLRELDVPIYGTKLTLGLLEAKLREAGLLGSAKLKGIDPQTSLRLGPFLVEFIRVNHSIADAVAVAIHTPAGTIVHTGDFKFDQTPVDQSLTDYFKFAALGEKGVLALLSDSTNAERPGYTMSEASVAKTFDEIFRFARGRIIVASFASNVNRIQQIISAAQRYNRKVAVVGRSMNNVISIASDLGYLVVPKGTLLDIGDISSLPQNRVVILTTGSQGEPMSGLTRIAMLEHKNVEIIPGDTVVISASPIPGNEKMIARIIDNLFRQGANVIYEEVSGIHVSGHASQEELKLMINLVRPKFFIPIHGEYRMLVKHARLAEELGIPEENIFVLENGQVLDLFPNRGVTSSRVTAGRVLVDGLGIGDVGNVVLRDRKQLAQDGIVIVVVTLGKDSGMVISGPDIVTRGFVYVREAEVL
ncbi:MAG: ribonuclease J, partial [Clostridia bacterium]|nr:ribonuclease J [Clostridia bacterium]